jgi:hypothetical protein
VDAGIRISDAVIPVWYSMARDGDRRPGWAETAAKATKGDLYVDLTQGKVTISVFDGSDYGVPVSSDCLDGPR